LVQTVNILHLSTSDLNGGAAKAAYRVHQGLQAIGLTSRMLVHTKLSDDPHVIVEKKLLTKLAPQLSGLPLKRYARREGGMFSSQWFADSLASAVPRLEPDIILLHWVCNGFVRIETLAKWNKPIVWTLHDMWPLTGGCHYSRDCDRYTQSCGACPQLGSHRYRDLSYRVWQRKNKAWKELNLALVAPSSWIAKCAASSSLLGGLRIETIPFGLDLLIYKPINKSTARDLLKLPQDKPLVLFGALAATKDQRKGFHLLASALQNLSQTPWKDRIEVVIFGASPPAQPIDVGFKTHYLGRLHDDIALILAYSSADVMIIPSIQESFGQTASEALACGTPVVAFNATGLVDIVDHQHNGYLAQPYESVDLAKGIAWVLEDRKRHVELCRQARSKAEHQFTLVSQSRRYLALIEDILG
jgi:glycosyltransferase involved in cell wall biosynthesis